MTSDVNSETVLRAHSASNCLLLRLSGGFLLSLWPSGIARPSSKYFQVEMGFVVPKSSKGSNANGVWSFAATFYLCEAHLVLSPRAIYAESD